jgi:hypothetical protein
MGYVKAGADGNEYVDWAKMKTMKWSDPKVMEQLSSTDIILPPDDRIFGKKEIDASKINLSLRKMWPFILIPFAGSGTSLTLTTSP